MTTISALTLGSCRVHGPMLAIAETGRCVYHKGGSGAYLHSCLEVQQRLEWLRGEREIEDGFAPYVFATETTPSLSDTNRKEALESDILLVEISSAKELTCRGVSIQLNYLWRRLLNALGSDGERWWRHLVANGSPSHEIVDRLLASPNFAEGAFGPMDELVLRNTQCAQSDVSALCDRLERLKELWCKPMAIISHVDMPLANGKTLASRSKFVADLCEAAQSCGIALFQPAVLFRQMGRVNTLAEAGADLDHLNPDFEKIYGWYLLNRVITPTLNGSDLPGAVATQSAQGAVA